MILMTNGNLKELREIGFKTEKEMQKFCEQNMEKLLGLGFIASEFHVAQFRFDSIAYNPTNNAFTIIEYKNDKNFSVIDQGYSYISTLLEHKADFVLKYNQVYDVSKGIADFDWTQVRVYFIAPQYTIYQINSINFSDLPMELWKLKRFENDIVSFEQVKPTSTNASISGYAGISAKEKKSGFEITEKPTTVMVYTEEDRLKDGTDVSQELYMSMRDYILSLDENIAMKPTKLYIGFLLHNHNMVDIKIQKTSIVIWLNTKYGTLDDPRHIITDVSHIGHHGNGDCQIKVSDRRHIGYIQDIIANHYLKLIE